MKLNRYYFTYGTDPRYPYSGGWTEIIAPDAKTACSIFSAVHPDRVEGLLNCAFLYPEKEFIKTEMYRDGDNFGHGCRETIRWRKGGDGDD